MGNGVKGTPVYLTDKDGEPLDITPEGRIRISKNDFCFGGDYGAAQTNQLILSPTSGKKLQIVQVYASTKSNTVDVTLKFAVSDKIFFKLYTALQGTAIGEMICAVGDVDEGVELTCGIGTFVSFAYNEI